MPTMLTLVVAGMLGGGLALDVVAVVVVAALVLALVAVVNGLVTVADTLAQLVRE